MPETPTSELAHGSRPNIDVTWRRFRVRSAIAPEDVDIAQRLRHQVFQEELLGQDAGGIDRDAYDDTCDHMLIFNVQDDEELIGTCRFRCSQFTSDFYTAGEFTIGGFLERSGIKVEMGRACIRRQHRNNLVIAALGQVIGAYARSVQARWFFGCSSVLTTDPSVVAGLSAWLADQGHTLPEREAAPRADHRLPGLADIVDSTMPLSDTTANELIPPLLRGYLRAGAVVSRQPAYDPDFRCVDYFTALDLSQSNSAFMGRYTAPC